MVSSSRAITRYYSGGQTGGASLPYFVGRQYGAGWLRAIARLALPLITSAVGAAGTVAAKTASDLIEDRKSFKESLKDNTLNEIRSRVLKRAAPINRSHVTKKKKRRTIFGHI